MKTKAFFRGNFLVLCIALATYSTTLAQSRLDQLLDISGSNSIITSVDYRYCQSPVKSQANRGTCTAFAMMAAMETFAGVPLDLSEQFAYADVKLSIYTTTKVYEGELLSTYVKCLENKGVVREDQEPYNPNATVWHQEDNKMDQYTAEVGGSRIYDLFTINTNKYKLDRNFYTLFQGDNARHSKAKIKEMLRGGLTCIPVGYTIYAPAWKENTGEPSNAIHPDDIYEVVVDGRLVTYSEAKQKYPNLADKIVNGEIDVALDTTSKNWGGHAVGIVGYTQKALSSKTHGM